MRLVVLAEFFHNHIVNTSGFFSLTTSLFVILTFHHPIPLFHRTAGGATEATRLLTSIFETEKMITGELKLLSDLRVFPSQELLLVRKDIKGFKDKTVITKIDKLEKEKIQINRSKEESLQNAKIIKNVPEYEVIIEVSAMEQLVTERKLSLFIERRKDEQEAKVHLSRKNAKSRAMQEVQSRDPSNFTNQKRF